MTFWQWFTGLFINDHEWKKKNCPTLHKYLFSDPETRHEMFEQMRKNNEPQGQRKKDMHE